ncbi:MAG: 23S rRNA (guanosine(2251)-2'-O)-methyltransferase RlmB [Chloroflexota bacterium]|jgi:23S rRNA (guanosine2251-2'-O)-methyltransferase
MREWIVGRQPVYEILRSGRRQVYRLLIAQSKDIEEAEKGRIADILAFCTKRKVEVERVQRDRLDGLGSGHQGVAIQTDPYPYLDLIDILDHVEERGDPAFLLILDVLQDPQNLGTLLRTAEAVGVHGVLLPLRRTATITPAVVSASSGASEYLSITQCNLAQAIETLKKEGIWVIGLDAGKDAQPPEHVNLNLPLALVVGSEGQGMRSLVRQRCDLVLRLPMRGKIASLNAATAGSVSLYLAWQAREYGRKQD